MSRSVVVALLVAQPELAGRVEQLGAIVGDANVLKNASPSARRRVERELVKRVEEEDAAAVALGLVERIGGFDHVHVPELLRLDRI